MILIKKFLEYLFTVNFEFDNGRILKVLRCTVPHNNDSTNTSQTEHKSPAHSTYFSTYIGVRNKLASEQAGSKSYSSFNRIADTMRSNYIAQIFELLKTLNTEKTFIFCFRIHYWFTHKTAFLYT